MSKEKTGFDSTKLLDLTRGAPPPGSVRESDFYGETPGVLGFDQSIKNNPLTLYYKGSEGGNFAGFRPLREQLALKHGVSFDQIVTASGGMSSMSIFLDYINWKLESKGLTRKACVLTESPTYDRFPHNLLIRRMDWFGIPFGKNGIDLIAFENILRSQQIDAFYGIYEGQNPTGYSYSAEEKREIERICDRYGTLVLWDGAYHNLTYGRINPEITDIPENVVYSFNFTKEVSAGAKLGYLVIGNKRITKDMLWVASNSRLNPPYIVEAWYHEYFKVPFFYKNHLEELRAMFGERVAEFVRIFSQDERFIFNKGIDSGYFLNLLFEGITNNTTLVNKLEQVGVIAGDSSVSFHKVNKNESRGVIRVPVVVMPVDVIQDLYSRCKFVLNH